MAGETRYGCVIDWKWLARHDCELDRKRLDGKWLARQDTAALSTESGWRDTVRIRTRLEVADATQHGCELAGREVAGATRQGFVLD